jgi:hypothetical protein
MSLHPGSFQSLKKEPETPYKLVETHQLKINRLQISSTGSARMEGLVQYYLKLPAASLDDC